MDNLEQTEPLTYRQDGPDSYFRDLGLVAVYNCPDARERLRRHAYDVGTRQEFRDEMSSPYVTYAAGAMAEGVPPLWLLEQYEDILRPARPYIEAIVRQPLPPATDSINMPRFLAGNLEDSVINAPVRAVGGQQAIKADLLRESPVAFDAIVWRDLVVDYAANTSRQALSGFGAGEWLGASRTQGIHRLSLDNDRHLAIENRIGDAITLIQGSRHLPPTHIVMHPNRWEALSEHYEDGRIRDLPVIAEPMMMPDAIHVQRTADVIMWESAPRARALGRDSDGEPLENPLLQVYAYGAFSAARYPASIAEITIAA